MRIVDVKSDRVVEELPGTPWEEQTTRSTKTEYRYLRLTGPRKAILFLTTGLNPRVAKKIRTVLGKSHQVRTVQEVRIKYGEGKESELALLAEIRPNGWERHMRDVLNRIDRGVDRSMRAAARDAAKAGDRQPASAATA